MPYCHACGSEVGEDVNYCPGCGADQRAEPSRKEHVPVRSTGSSLAGRTWTNALVGATVGFVLGLFVAAVLTPFYLVGIMGGAALAGYLQDRGGTAGGKVGALAGLLATAPVMLLILLGALIGFGGLALGFVGHATPLEGALGFMGIGLLIVVVFFVSTIANVLFGALGGIVGGALAEE